MGNKQSAAQRSLDFIGRTTVLEENSLPVVSEDWHEPALPRICVKVGVAESVLHLPEDHHDLVLLISFSVGSHEWKVLRTPSQIWKMHLELNLTHLGAMVSVHDIHWYRVLVKNRHSVTPEECDDFERYFEGILRHPKLRSSDVFCEFAEVSASSFLPSVPKPLLEGYAKKRRGGRRFMLRGCSLAVGGVRSFFRAKFSKRWFTLRPDFIAYTASRESETVLDVILFDSEFVCELIPPSEGRVGTMTPSFMRSSSVRDTRFLKIQNGYRKIIMCFDSSARASEWMHAIQKAHSHSEWNQHHRFGSFAPPRELGPGASAAKFLIDGVSYYPVLAEALRSASKEIYMTGWWLVGEIPLTRPGIRDSVIDLLAQAASRGVGIFIVLYKELSMALALDSIRTKRNLEAIHPNIKVMLHPRQFGARAVLAWSHHQKLVIVDHKVAFLGGLDLCLGRFDQPQHRLVDFDSIFPGQDYCNPCLRDCVDMTRPMADLMDRNKEPRLPWHDVHCQLEGPVVTDLVRHFVQLWNHVRTDKHRADTSLQVLQIRRPQEPEPVPEPTRGLKGKLKKLFRKRQKKQNTQSLEEEDEDDSGSDVESATEGPSVVDDVTNASASVLGRSLSLLNQSEVGIAGLQQFSGLGRSQLSIDGLLHAATLVPRIPTVSQGRVQFLRSGSWWSMGLPTDTSIQNAYLELIQSATKYIYIENQFFVTSCTEGGEVKNLIGRAIADRIISAHKNNQPLKVYVIMPVMPAFENSQLLLPTGFVTRITLQHQFNSLTRGSGSILGYMQRACGGDKDLATQMFNSHMIVCGLRQFDVWPTPDGTVRTEQLYVHSKVMVIDDRVAIIGSANINDRSMMGDRDSEIAVCVEDFEFASQLRKQLWHEHFGLKASHPSLEIESDLEENRAKISESIADPWSPDCFETWKTTAIQNADVFRQIFGVVPCDEVRTRKQFEARMSLNANRVVQLNNNETRAKLATLRGRIVAFQHKFLELEDRLQDPMPASASLCPSEIFS
jgi:phospholipase D1/2